MKFQVFWENPGYQVRPELKEDITCDYLIVGGGITGVSAAYLLAKMGARNIVLAEKKYIGSGATGQAAGTVVMRAERELLDLIQDYGEQQATVLWEETHKALRELSDIAKVEHIEDEVEIVDTLACGFKKKTFNNVRAEYAAEKRLESETELLEGEDLQREINSPLFTHGMLSKKHGFSVNPLKFIQKFSQAAEKHGVKIYENTAVLQAKDGVAKTQHGDIRYKKIFWAIDVDYPEDELKNLKTTIIVTRPLTTEEVEKIGFAHRRKVVWDSRKNENYFKLTHDNRLLMGFGGVIVHKKHKKTDPHHPHLKQLETWLKKVFPYLDLEIEYAWSGHFGVNLHYSKGPLARLKGDEAMVAGCGSQVLCYMGAKHMVKAMLGKESNLTPFFS